MKKSTIILRASAMLAAISVLVVGVTYAAITSTATLTDNTISSATATLLVDGSDGNQDQTASEPGFSFTNLVPGDDFSDPQTLRLENDGTAPMTVTVHATGGTSTGILDKSKVHVKFVNTTVDPDEEETYTLAELETLFNNVPGMSGDDQLDDQEIHEVTVQVKLDADAVSGGGASLSGFNFVFTGTTTTDDSTE
jgi:hypothetical protein